MDNKITFEESLSKTSGGFIIKQKMNIRDPHNKYFQEGLVALWNAYQTYQPDEEAPGRFDPFH